MFRQVKYGRNQFPENSNTVFSFEREIAGSKKNCQYNGFHKYLNKTKFLDSNPEDTCYYQGTRETLVDTTLINIRESIFRETLVTSTKEAAEVASEDKDTLVSTVAQTCRTVLFSKDSLNKRFVCSLLNAKNEKTKPLFV